MAAEMAQQLRMMLLFQRIQDLFPTPTFGSLTACDFSSMEYEGVFRPP